MLIIINLQLVSVFVIKVNSMDFSCSNVDSIPGNGVSGVRIVTVLLDIFSFKKYRQKYIKMCKRLIINPCDISSCIRLLVLINHSLTFIAFPGLCNCLGTFTCKAEQIFKEAF